MTLCVSTKRGLTFEPFLSGLSRHCCRNGAEAAGAQYTLVATAPRQTRARSCMVQYECYVLASISFEQPRTGVPLQQFVDDAVNFDLRLDTEMRSVAQDANTSSQAGALTVVPSAPGPAGRVCKTSPMACMHAQQERIAITYNRFVRGAGKL